MRAYISYQDRKGDTILQDSGPTRMRSKPLAHSIDTRQWSWKIVLSCQWKLEDEHINGLEARARLLALRRRSRSASRSKRFLRLTDSKVAIGSYAKHRPSSFNHIVTRSAALQLAASMNPVLAFVRSGRNPADFPSRKLARFRPHGPSAPRSQPQAADS